MKWEALILIIALVVLAVLFFVVAWLSGSSPNRGPSPIF
jgi:VIT1/CCC1 family predicted Fe2+/Mn2+ transporter